MNYEWLKLTALQPNNNNGVIFTLFLLNFIFTSLVINSYLCLVTGHSIFYSFFFFFIKRKKQFEKFEL